MALFSSSSCTPSFLLSSSRPLDGPLQLVLLYTELPAQLVPPSRWPSSARPPVHRASCSARPALSMALFSSSSCTPSFLPSSSSPLDGPLQLVLLYTELPAQLV